MDEPLGVVLPGVRAASEEQLMAIKKKDVEGEAPAEVPETRKCECGDHADVWDGRCRRCGLSG